MQNEEINLQYLTIKDPLPDFIYEGLKTYSSGANGYRPQPQVLVEKLANKHNIPKEMIYLTAGIDEAIQMFIHAYGDNTYTFTPTYIVYADTRVFGKKFNEIYSVKQNIFEISPNKIADASLIFLANPNNPSGFTEKMKAIELVDNNKHSIVVIDEAYGDFADLSVIDLLPKYKNMVVFRSFSKSFGMAGNRIGYLMADPEIIKIVKNKAQWANVSYLSVGAAIAALDHEEYFKSIIKSITKLKDSFMNFLEEEGYTCLPSKINAVVIKFPDEEKGTRFVEYLSGNNIIVSHSNGNSNIGLDKSFVRFAIGNEEQMKIVEKIIQDYKNN
jgi:histidinol-phosphate aminotransferase